MYKWFITGVIAVGLVVPFPAFADDIEEGLEALRQSQFEDAAKKFSKSFDDGKADGAFYLGRMLELGIGGEANPAGALVLYKAAAEKDSPKALNRLGLMHFRGELGMLQDFTEARDLLCQSGDLGDKDGQFNCAEMYKEGRGGNEDKAKAMEYYQRAADQGHIGAQNTLGNMYKQGTDVEKSLEKAQTYYEQTASVGNPVGLFELAKMFENGRPIAKDLAKAHLYYNLANARLHPEAATGLQRVSAQMNGEELQRAQQRPRPGKQIRILVKQNLSR